jgi:predicted transcriptional regulator
MGRMKSMKFSCPPDLVAWIQHRAEVEGSSESRIIRNALREAATKEATK